MCPHTICVKQALTSKLPSNVTFPLGLGGLCSILAVLCYAPMLVKTTIMLQPQAYYAHTMLMNIINSLHLAVGTHPFIQVTSCLVVITKWLRIQEVVVTTVILVLLADSQTVQSQEIALYLQCQFWITSSPRQNCICMT